MMERVYISDVTIKEASISRDFSLSFKEKIELSKLLDKLDVSVIELDELRNKKVDSLLVKSIASAVRNSVVAVPVDLVGEKIDSTWEVLKGARFPRLQVPAPVSIVQMEYLTQMKPEEILECIENSVKKCRSYCNEVEFIADDASRSDLAFLKQAIETAIDAGANIITICDTAGTMLPDEFEVFINKIKKVVTGIGGVRIGVACANEIAMADSSAIAAIKAGVREIKASTYNVNSISLENVAKVISSKGHVLGVVSDIRYTEINRVLNQIKWICETNRSVHSPFDMGVQDHGEESFILSAHDSQSAVAKVAKTMGYELSEDDEVKVYEAFQRIANKKGTVGRKELDSIVASVAMQVPPTYTVHSYVINTGNIITAMAHLKLTKGEEVLEGISIGDGPIDAAFLAIENIIGTHYELDDFQIQAVTQGREAMGETVVKLRSNGRVYSGHGISTDIVGASIRAYINALNKIAYEELEA